MLRYSAMYECFNARRSAAENAGVNTRGEVIGISQSIYNPDNDQSNIGIGFAIPVNEVKKFVYLAKNGKKF